MSETTPEPEHPLPEHETHPTPDPVPEAPIAPAAPHEDIPAWGREVIASVSSLAASVQAMVEASKPVPEPERDRAPESVPWTHRGSSHDHHTEDE